MAGFTTNKIVGGDYEFHIDTPNVARTVMMTICVGKPEQRMTSSAAAARSTGSARVGVGSVIGVAGSTRRSY